MNKTPVSCPVCASFALLNCRVGIRPPGIEVRFQDIFIETSVYTNVSRNLPSILNAYRGFLEVSQQSTFCYVVHVVLTQARSVNGVVSAPAVTIATHSQKVIWHHASSPECSCLAVWNQLASCPC